MKKLMVAIAAVLMLFSAQASAQGKFGITAGMNFNTDQLTGIDVKAKVGWNVGVTYALDLPLGFSLQPALVYNQKGANLINGVSQTMDYLELPVSVQWGPDLILFRPFIDVTPYIGYALSNKLSINTPIINVNELGWEGKQRFEYGLGLGAGVDVWKLRIIARYNWNFGSLYQVQGWDDIKEHFPDLKTSNEHFGGISINVALFF